MKKFMTPIFLVTAIIIVIAIPVALYYLTIGSGGGMGLAGMIALSIGIVSFFVLYIERNILKQYRPKLKLVWIIEIPLIIGAVFIYLYSEREVIYTVDDSVDWFARVLVDENYEIPEPIFPFKINYKIGTRQVIFINPKIDQSYDRDHVSWGGYWTDGFEIIVDGKKYWVCINYNPRVSVKDNRTEDIKRIVAGEIHNKNTKETAN